MMNWMVYSSSKSLLHISFPLGGSRGKTSFVLGGLSAGGGGSRTGTPGGL